MRITVKGNPVALKRHRTLKNGFSYDPSAKEKQNFLLTVQNQAPDIPIDEPIKLKIVFSMQRPKSHYRTGKFSKVLKDAAPLFHRSRPDLDNLIKFIADSLNGIFYRDDSQIAEITARKIYSSTPKTEIEIKTL